ncbi:MAG: PIG-L deacetylase family protein [Kiritimatiellia bacterium]
MAARIQLRLALAAGLLAGIAAPAAAADRAPLRLGEDERLLVLAAHPGDETLAAGGLIQEARELDLPVRVCFFTMGDNNEIAALFTRRHPALRPGPLRASGQLRQNEALAAATQLGLSAADVVFLGYPDSGTLDIWNHHWRTVPPYRSALTRANAVPYDAALTPGSAHAGEDVLDDLVDVFRDFRPTHLVLPHPADHNVDHRALYLFARVALWNLADDGVDPQWLAAPIHFTRWPEPRRARPDQPAEPPAFLEADAAWLEYGLASFQVSKKLAALRRHHSQFLHSAALMQAFIRKTEVFAALSDWAFPGGAGSVEIAETDDTEFRPDENLFQELAQESDSWHDVAGQHAAETEALAGFDNDFVQSRLEGDGQTLTVAFRFRRPVAAPARVSLRLFGYRGDVPFGDLPKIEIEATPREILAVADLHRRQPADSVQLLPDGDDEIAVRVPYARLGRPEKILVGAMLMKNRLPIDGIPWRVLDLAGAPLPEDPVPPAPQPPAPAADPAPPPAVRPEAPAVPPPSAPPALAPRVTLPRRAVPDKTEANEPVLW